MPPSKKYKILFVTPEVMPFVKTGGIADVSSALPQKLQEAGHQVRVFVPKYGAIDERKFKIHEVVRLKNMPLNIGDKEAHYSVRSSFLVGPKTRIQIYFLDNEEYFGSRHSLYSDPLTKEDYVDNDERYSMFCRAALELVVKLGWIPDIIHCNDWQCGLIPVYQKTIFKDIKELEEVKTIFTIHNMSAQGEFPKSTFSKLNLPAELCNEELLLHKGKVNFLKGALIYSDLINTVSPSYAKEIFSDKEISKGLNKTLNNHKKEIFGIINGIETNLWNPSTDKLIEQRYSSKNLFEKTENKKALIDKFGLLYEENAPVISMISKLVDVKGINLIQEVFEELMDLNIRLIILGTGEKKYHRFFEEVFCDNPDKFSCYLGFDDELAHLVEAGSDMFLMPSLYEPCGLNQMYSLVYGTVPIVHETGGLADTVKKYNEETKEGNGFSFAKFNSKEMVKEIKRAVNIYQSDRTAWKNIMLNGMKENFDWTESVKKYVELYRKVYNQN